MVQETISYYINNGSHVVMCMQDASQAFDRVNLLTLFKKLHCKRMCHWRIYLCQWHYIDSAISRKHMSYNRQDIIFNPLKSQCIFFCKCKTLWSPYSVLFKRNDIEFVDSCKLLCVKISRDITDRHIYIYIFSCAWLLQKK